VPDILLTPQYPLSGASPQDDLGPHRAGLWRYGSGEMQVRSHLQMHVSLQPVRQDRWTHPPQNHWQRTGLDWFQHV
jgi:hypothetical protein